MERVSSTLQKLVTLFYYNYLSMVGTLTEKH